MSETDHACDFCGRQVSSTRLHCEHCGFINPVAGPDETRTADEVVWFGDCFHDFMLIFGNEAPFSELQKAEEFWPKCQGKRIRWSGYVGEVARDPSGALRLDVRITPETPQTEVVLFLREAEKTQALKLTKGDVVTFSGVLKARGAEASLPIVVEDGLVLGEMVLPPGKFLGLCFHDLHSGLLRLTSHANTAAQEDGGEGEGGLKGLGRLLVKAAKVAKEEADRINSSYWTICQDKHVDWWGEVVSVGVENQNLVMKVKHLRDTITCDAVVGLKADRAVTVRGLAAGSRVHYTGRLWQPGGKIKPWTLEYGVVEADALLPPQTAQATPEPSGRTSAPTVGQPESSGLALVNMALIAGEKPELADVECPTCKKQNRIYPRRLSGNPSCSGCGAHWELRWGTPPAGTTQLPSAIPQAKGGCLVFGLLVPLGSLLVAEAIRYACLVR